ncbi:MAG: hypothetical protein U9Q83_04755, partial [Bacteroidota bacterium]|nr:hypothetical protein [Bacteroidota bacterium]
MIFKNNIDLIVTSNNFFYFKYNQEIVLNNLVNSIKRKKHIIIGVDYLNKYNPIGGISSQVTYYKNYVDKYFAMKKIWETYPCKANKARKRFNLQNRTIKIKNK